MKTIAQLIILSFISLLVFSCEESADCGLYSTRQARLQFYKYSKSKLVDTTISNVTVKGLTAEKYSIKNGSALRLNLLLNQESDTSVYVMDIDSVFDTLRFITKRELKMVSSDCGFNTAFTLQSFSCTRNKIDTFLWQTGEVTDNAELNVKLIMRVWNENTTKRGISNNIK